MCTARQDAQFNADHVRCAKDELGGNSMAQTDGSLQAQPASTDVLNTKHGLQCACGGGGGREGGGGAYATGSLLGPSNMAMASTSASCDTVPLSSKSNSCRQSQQRIAAAHMLKEATHHTYVVCCGIQ